MDFDELFELFTEEAFRLETLPVYDVIEEKEAIKEYPEWPMFRKFERLNDLLMVKLENELYGRYYSYNVEEQKKLTRYYTNYFNKFIWKTSVFSLYKEFVDKKMAEGWAFNYEEDKPDLYDLASLAYIYKRIKETEVIQEASHVVIDEAQDFGMMVYKSASAKRGLVRVSVSRHSSQPHSLQIRKNTNTSVTLTAI